MKILFVGGIADGKTWMSDYAAHTVNVPVWREGGMYTAIYNMISTEGGTALYLFSHERYDPPPPCDDPDCEICAERREGR